MLIFPIGTDRPQRRFPWMNVLLIVANFLMYLASQPIAHGLATPGGDGAIIPGVSPYTGLLKQYDSWLLDPSHPHLYQFITYQFLHHDFMHILFNMLFLYVFGNNLNEKLGHLGYLLFYLTGGILAGCGQMLTSNAPTLGASGAISAVAGLFLVLLPRTHIRMFVSIFFLYMDVWEIPSMFFVLFKMGEDVFEQVVRASNVAYMAHLSGYFSGILIGLFLLYAKLVQRDHYDLLGILNRYRRRKSYESLVAGGYNPFTTPSSAAQPTSGGILAAVLPGKKPAGVPTVDPRIDSLRTEIARLIRVHELPDALVRYLELRTIDPAQILPVHEQLDIANQLMADGRYPEAAAAYEDYLRVYPKADQHDQIMLMLGLIYARYYPKLERARELFITALPRLHDAQQRAMAEAELQKLGVTPPPPPPTAPPADGPSVTPA